MNRCLAYATAVGVGPVHWLLGLRPERRLLAGVATCLVVPILFHGWYIAFGGNFYTVVPGLIYRSAQPSQADLQTLVLRYGISIVINLRGETDEPWYGLEHDTARALHVQVVDVGLWATQAPPADQFRLLVDTLAEEPGPMLVHCNSGGDRSGLAAALGVLLRTDGSLTEARRQLSLYYGHNPYGKAITNDRVLDSYEQWLTNNGWQHCPARLRLWATSVYSPDGLKKADRSLS